MKIYSEIYRVLQNVSSDSSVYGDGCDSDYRPYESNSSDNGDDEVSTGTLNLPLPTLHILNNEEPFDISVGNETYNDNGTELNEGQNSNNFEVLAIENLPFLEDLGPVNNIVIEFEEYSNFGRE